MTYPASESPTYHKEDLSIPLDKANVYSLGISLPLAVLLTLAYLMVWETDRLREGLNALFGNFFIFLAVFAVGIVLHELIHGLTWMIAGHKPLSAIKFGFQARTFTPYAHCTEPMKVNAYRLGAAMPGILLGLLPALTGILNGNGWLFGFGILFTVAAGGDFAILWLLQDVESDKLVEDHPTQAGCYILHDSPRELDLE